MMSYDVGKKGGSQGRKIEIVLYSQLVFINPCNQVFMLDLKMLLHSERLLFIVSSLCPINFMD